MDLASILKDYSDYITIIATLSSAYWIYSKQKKVKKLSEMEVNLSSILQFNNHLSNSIQVIYKNEKMKNIWLLVINFQNIGNTPIKVKDFENPINIQINGTNRILESEAIDLHPNNLNISSKVNPVDSKNLIIEPCLLNPDERFSIKLLISGSRPIYKTTARIAGISHISKVFPHQQKERSGLGLLLKYKFLTPLILIVLLTFTYISTKNIFTSPEVEVLNKDIYELNDGSIEDLDLIPSNGSAANKHLIYYQINNEPKLHRVLFNNGKWTIKMDNKKNNLINGVNQLCYNFNRDRRNTKCLDIKITLK